MSFIFCRERINAVGVDVFSIAIFHATLVSTASTGRTTSAEGRFREQSAEYQKNVIPDGIPVLGLTAGLPVTLQGLVGPYGKVIGMENFGFSAPYKVLDEKLGYTAANVFNKAVELIWKTKPA